MAEPELHDFKLPFISLIELIRSNLSFLFIHVNGTTLWYSIQVERPASAADRAICIPSCVTPRRSALLGRFAHNRMTRCLAHYTVGSMRRSADNYVWLYLRAGANMWSDFIGGEIARIRRCFTCHPAGSVHREVIETGGRYSQEGSPVELGLNWTGLKPH